MGQVWGKWAAAQGSETRGADWKETGHKGGNLARRFEGRAWAIGQERVPVVKPGYKAPPNPLDSIVMLLDLSAIWQLGHASQPE